MEVVIAVGIVAVVLLIVAYMTFSYLGARDALQAVRLADAEKKYVDERIAEIDKALGKTLAPILDDIGQIKSKLSLEKYI